MSYNFTQIFTWRGSPHQVEQNNINFIQNGHLVAELQSFYLCEKAGYYGNITVNYGNGNTANVTRNFANPR